MSASNAGDRGSVPGSGRSPGEGNGNPLHYSWTSLLAQMVKKPPAMWETSLRSLDWEDPLEKGMATHSSSFTWRSPTDRGAWWATVHEVSESDRAGRLSLSRRTMVLDRGAERNGLHSRSMEFLVRCS